MVYVVPRRRLLASLAALFAIGPRAVLAVAGEASEFDDPFLGQTTQGDLILAPSKTAMAATLPERHHFFGIVRKTNVLMAEGAGDKVNMFMLFAAFDSGCQLSLCNMETLAGSTSPSARYAYQALTAIAQRVKARPDSVYAIQDVEKLSLDSCRRRAEV